MARKCTPQKGKKYRLCLPITRHDVGRRKHGLTDGAGSEGQSNETRQTDKMACNRNDMKRKDEKM